MYKFLRRYYVGHKKVRRILRRMKGSCGIPTLKTGRCVGLILRTFEGVRGIPTLLSSGPMPNFSPGLENFQEVPDSGVLKTYIVVLVLNPESLGWRILIA